MILQKESILIVWALSLVNQFSEMFLSEFIGRSTNYLLLVWIISLIDEHSRICLAIEAVAEDFGPASSSYCHKVVIELDPLLHMLSLLNIFLEQIGIVVIASEKNHAS